MVDVQSAIDSLAENLNTDNAINLKVTNEFLCCFLSLNSKVNIGLNDSDEQLNKGVGHDLVAMHKVDPDDRRTADSLLIVPNTRIAFAGDNLEETVSRVFLIIYILDDGLLVSLSLVTVKLVLSLGD